MPDLIKYLRGQALLLTQIADEIEQGQEVTLGWALDVSPGDSKMQELLHKAINDGQEVLNAEHEQAVEEEAA